MYFIALVPLILFGLYKNGIELYVKGLVSFIEMFKPLIILFMSLAGALVGCLFRERSSIKNNDFHIFDKFKGNIVEAILLSSILPLKTSPIIVFVISLLFSAFGTKMKVNKVALMFLLVTIFNIICGINTFDNVYETSTVLNYNGLDLFFGLGTGGIFSTSIILILIGLLFLSFNKLYKKEMVLSSIITFVLLGIVSYMIMGKYTEIFPLIFGYNILFTFVFIEPNLYSSSYTVKGQVLSGVLIGIFTYILSYIAPYMAASIAVLIASLLKNILDRIFVIK